METVNAPRTVVNIIYNDHNITTSLAPYLISFEYTDFASDQVDDISISINDPDGRWCNRDYPTASTRITASIIDIGEASQSELKCGSFIVDSPSYAAPGVMTIKATSASIVTSLRKQAEAKRWEHITLKQLAQQLAAKHGTTIIFESADTPQISKADQKDESDLAFLLRVCKREGYALKTESNRLVIVKRSEWDARTANLTLYRDGGIVSDWSFEEDRDAVYSSCIVRYKPPKAKKMLEAVYAPENAPENGQVLIVREHVGSQAEAERVAKARYEAANRGRFKGNLICVGSTTLCSGMSIKLSGWGVYDGRYAIDEARHSVSPGYTTTLAVVKLL
ncbi:MAG: contractile injection system protein, VgrG/Pvc8 family [Armatimonadota bacterium]|nr:hypothetical protein [bacterium]